MYDESPDSSKNAAIQEIRKKIRVLILLVSFVIATLFSIVFALLYDPISTFFDFFPALSISVIMFFTFILAVLGFYLLIAFSRQALRMIENYGSRLDKLLFITKELREEEYGDILLKKIMDYALSITNSDAGSLLLVDDAHKLVFRIISGSETSPLLGMSIEFGKGLTGWAAEKGTSIRVNDVSKDNRFSPDYDAITGYQTRSIMCAPLKTKDTVIGMLVLLNKKNGHPYRPRDEEIITYIADQAAISIMKTRFSEDQRNYEIPLTEILLEAIDFQLPDKKGHSKRVARYSSVIAKALQLPEESQKKIYFASLLHDVGFLKMHSSDVFSKEEFMKHPVVGYEMIKPINFYADISSIILHHHERYDGFGYPSQLKGDEIPFASRIISIAEAFDAMTSATSYKIPISYEDALDELRKNSGTQFDPDFVEVFVSNISQKHAQ
jgi:putative nucleotidyltransferase with HDIG domain